MNTDEHRRTQSREETVILTRTAPGGVLRVIG
jgi:hypothetical protein